jgi:hypothetical protein
MFTAPTAPDLSAQQWGSISTALQAVEVLRSIQLQQPALQMAVAAIKQSQCLRFEQVYADVLANPKFAPAAHFFLQELYAARDFSQRDAQFSRIAPAIERLFPSTVVTVATTLCQLHALSESLDHRMAAHLVTLSDTTADVKAASQNYVALWRAVAQSTARRQQLALVQQLGDQLNTITRIPGLRITLRMMRKPAQTAGLTHLQHFLERGFDTFADLRRSKAGVGAFLQTIETRENAWLDKLDDPRRPVQVSAADWPELHAIAHG